jgi:hypothetical protein
MKVDLPPAFGPVIIKLLFLSSKISFFTKFSILGCLSPFIFIFGSNEVS